MLGGFTWTFTVRYGGNQRWRKNLTYYLGYKAQHLGALKGKIIWGQICHEEGSLVGKDRMKLIALPLEKKKDH